MLTFCYRQTPARINIGLSSYVDTSRSHTTVSTKEGLIKMKVAKHHLWNTGIYLLPRCMFKPSTLSPTTATALSSYVGEPKLLLGEMFSGPDRKLKERNISTNSPPFYGLRATLQIMWLDCIQNPEVNMFNTETNKWYPYTVGLKLPARCACISGLREPVKHIRTSCLLAYLLLILLVNWFDYVKQRPTVPI